jgi:hypothetical protein
MTDISYFYPCTGRFANRPECTVQPCATPCPFEKYSKHTRLPLFYSFIHVCHYVGRFPAGLCCIRKVSQPYNLEGEFYWHGKSDFKVRIPSLIILPASFLRRCITHYLCIET